MVINGKEVKFRRTVKANIELAKLCPKEDLRRLGELFDSESVVVAINAEMRFIAILNQCYEDAKAYNEPGYKQNPITMQELENLDFDELNELFVEAAGVYADDGKQTVIAEPVKKTADGEITE